MHRFPHFQDEWLRDLQPEVWVPAKFKGQPFNIFETGGTTGMPKQRIGWDDYKVDYEEFSEKISDEHFPAESLLADGRPDRPAPLAPRDRTSRECPRQFLLLHRSRSALGEEGHRGKESSTSRKAYMDHVVDQAVDHPEAPQSQRLLHHAQAARGARPKRSTSTRPASAASSAAARPCTRKYVRFIVEEVLESRIGFYPTYGNTLDGPRRQRAADSREDNFSITYYAPQPRAVLRVVDPKDTDQA